MRHAVLGGGGIGGLLAGALARSGAEVVVLLRPATLAGFSGRLVVESVVLGDFEVELAAASRLDRPVDVLWVATKATQLQSALSLASADRVGEAFVVPLLNGVDHLALLRSRYANVVAAAIRVESERVSPGLIRQTSPFLGVELAGTEAARAALRAAGIECRARDDERWLLWDKLVFLAPIALATTARDAPLGTVRESSDFVACRNEAVAVARAEGAEIDADAVAAMHEAAPPEIRSSMQKDVAAGRPAELEAIAGPISNGGKRHGIPTPSTDRLVEQIRTRARA